jgi:hypothetical protein
MLSKQINGKEKQAGAKTEYTEQDEQTKADLTIRSETDFKANATENQPGTSVKDSQQLPEVKAAGSKRSVDKEERDDEDSVSRYLRLREEEKNAPEPNHTEILQEQLQKAAEITKKTYIDANKAKKPKFAIKNKQTLYK